MNQLMHRYLRRHLNGKTINAAIGGVGILLGRRALKLYIYGRILDWRLSQPGFDASFGNLACLATLMSSDRTKQICLWMTIYIYIYFSGLTMLVLIETRGISRMTTAEFINRHIRNKCKSCMR